MAKIRRNHQSKGRAKSQGLIFRSVLYVFFIIVILLFLFQFINNFKGSVYDTFEPISDEGSLFYLPEGSNGQIVDHGYFQLSYNENTEQADWVAYVLKKEELRVPNVPRSKKFFKDPKVSTGSAHHKDYSNSGFTRGHLAPAGDMAYSEDAMRTSFYMSNMSPQVSACNGGIWKELEESVRDWAFDNDELIIITGPIFDTDYSEKIGTAKVSVPDSFFKVILDIREPEIKGIGFLIPNERSERLLQEYAVSIDELETLTGFDFFKNLLDDDEEVELESDFRIDQWAFSEKRYQLRITKWNQF